MSNPSKKTKKKTPRKKTTSSLKAEGIPFEGALIKEVTPKEVNFIEELNRQVDSLDKEMAPIQEKLRQMGVEKSRLNDALLEAVMDKNIQRWERLRTLIHGTPSLVDLLAPEHITRCCENDPVYNNEVGEPLCPKCTLQRLLSGEYDSWDLRHFTLNLHVDNE